MTDFISETLIKLFVLRLTVYFGNTDKGIPRVTDFNLGTLMQTADVDKEAGYISTQFGKAVQSMELLG